MHCLWGAEMLEVLGHGLSWLVLVFFGSQVAIFIGLIFWSMWTDAITPRLIPFIEIERAADEIIAKFADPEQEAFERHQQAWYRCEGAEQAYWYRIRKAVRRQLSAGNHTKS
jgi:hypothetical protein